MSSIKEIREKYPELKPPGPKYWLIPAIIIALSVFAWSMQDTEMVEFTRNSEGKVVVQTPDYRWGAALNILAGVQRQVTVEVGGKSIPIMKVVDGEMVPITRRVGGLMRPDFTKRTMKSILPDMFETIEIALIGTLIAIVFAFPLSFLAARNIVGAHPAGMVIYGVVRFIFNFLSAIPALVVALIFTVIVGVGPAAGVLALGFHSIGMLGRLFAEALESVDKGPIEALQAVGAGKAQTVAYGVVPQIGPLFLAYSIYRWDINVRMSMILGFVGAGGIGVFLQQNINLFSYTKVSTAFILILVAVTLLDLFSGWVQRKIL
ncbi:MAG: phosphonate ABC transporter, permease protein PhnE [bacterium]|nr:phosphonate ABC transporter, permease protein PhnE [bacterium]